MGHLVPDAPVIWQGIFCVHLRPIDYRPYRDLNVTLDLYSDHKIVLLCPTPNAQLNRNCDIPSIKTFQELRTDICGIMGHAVYKGADWKMGLFIRNPQDLAR